MDSESWAAVLVRWGTFISLLLVVGAVAFRFLVLRRLSPSRFSSNGPLGDPEPRIASLGLAAAVALIPLTLGRLLLQVAAFREPSDPWLEPALLLVSDTTWGVGWWTQISAALLCAGGFSLVRRPGGTPAGSSRWSGWTLAAASAVGLALTPALSGHAIGSPRFTALAVAADTLHVLGAGAWLGSLAVMLATVLRPGILLHSADLVRVVAAFSRVALTSAALVVLSGLLASWLHVGTPSLLWSSSYGRVLLAKVTLFVLVVALGALNWRRLTPALGSERGASRLRVSSRTELAVTLLVLLATAILVATPLPGEE